MDPARSEGGGPVQGGPVEGGPVEGGPVEGGPVEGGTVEPRTGARARLGAAIARALDGAAASTSRLAQAGFSWVLWPVLISIAAGSAIWFAQDRAKRLPWFDSNKFPDKET